VTNGRPTHSEDELRDLSEHASYECDMLIGTATKLPPRYGV
jgi:hypothetical protein